MTHTFSNLNRQGVGNSVKTPQRLQGAFTLIELLIVIAIIAILAGLVLTVTGATNRSKIRGRTRVEMTELIAAIENYKTKMGHYPPDSGGRPDISPLYFELLGCKLSQDGSSYETLDGSASIKATPNLVQRVYGVSGFINCSGKTTGDEARVARRFLAELKPSQIGYSKVPAGFEDAKFLICSVPATYQDQTFVPSTGNRWRYVSNNPTNNPNSFDLWVDVVISGKTNRICNWSKDPLNVIAP